MSANAAQRSALERVRIDLRLNGVARNVEADPFASLAETLRGIEIDGKPATGTKIGCDAGDCGACTVLMDGEAVCACLVASVQADGASIETIERQGDPILDRLREAFLAHGAVQCGICTPGMLMAARALLSRNPTPTQTECLDAIGGVLCRCTGYLAIVDAIVAAAAGSQGTAVPDHAVADRPSVGCSVEKQGGRAATTGTLVYGADRAPEGALWLRVVRSPHAAATFRFTDLEGFRVRHGLAAILTAKDIPGANSFGIFPTTKDQPVLADGLARFRGEAIALLVGDSETLASIDDADFPVEYAVLPAVSGVEAALAAGARAIHGSHADNVLTRGNLRQGDVDAAFAAASVTVGGSFETSFVEHAYIEPEAGWAVRNGDRITVAATTQAPYMDREDVARVLGIADAQVEIRPTACGGGFGGKLDVSVQPLLAVAAWVLNVPVRMIYTRTESMVSTTKRHPSRISARAAADPSGRVTAYEMTGDFNTGAYASWGPTVANRVPIHASGPYRVANVRNRTRAVYTNDTPAGAFRGFGVPQAAIAHETLMDDLAVGLGIDRWQIRRINALAAGDTTASGQVLVASAGLPQCLDALKPAWQRALEECERHNAVQRRRRRGVGVACMWYGCGNTSMSNPSQMRITLGRDGVFRLWSGATDIGQGSATIMRQIAADALGVPLPMVQLGGSSAEAFAPSTDEALDAGKTSASRQTFVSGNAARLAAEDLRTKISRLVNCGPEARFEAAGNGSALAIVEGRERREVALASLVAGTSGLEGYGRYDPPTTALDADGQGTPYATYGFAAQVAEVEVDMDLATVRVLHIHAAHDVGRAINPLQVIGQIHGGIAQGLGLALMEEYIPGRTENLHDYLIPTAGDMPPISVHIIEDPDPEGPYGAKGVGEPALVATAPAILSAIRHATGVTVRHVPVLPHRLWAALQAQRRGVR